MKIKLDPKTGIERNVAAWARKHAADCGGFENLFKDLFYGGCMSGMVSHLIYYTDTLKFYRAHRAEINQMLTDAINDGLISSPADLNGWDSTDPLAQDTLNQNLLAWYGFETAARNLADRAGLDV